VRLVVEGFFGPAAPPSMVELCAVLSDTKHSGLFLATLNGEPIAGGAMGIWQGVACLFGDGTPKRYRGRGGQSALIRARLAAAAEAGCHVALAYTMCDSTSQRNYERAGFQVAYTRTKWCREFLAGAEKT
jgi:GNAT superfamily N-acetyltransferase